MKNVELAIIGAGPAGMSAANEAVDAGLRSVFVADGNRLPGGQFYRQVPHELQTATPIFRDRYYAAGQQLIAGLKRDPVEFMADTVVWGILPDENIMSLADAKECWNLKADTFLLATGAYDRPMPFPGWTLPGVFAVGAAQIQLKTFGVLPGQRVLVAGTGPLQLLLTKQLIDAGANVVAVLEAQPKKSLWQYMRHMAGFWDNWAYLGDGIRYLRTIRSAGVPYLTSHTVIEAQGKSEVERAVVAKLDGRARPIPGSEQVWDVDAICTGFGLLPSTELARVCGCAFDYVPTWGYMAPVVNEQMQSSVPNVYIAGDMAGIRGGHTAEIQGRLAAISIARRLGRVNAQAFEKRDRKLRSDLNRLYRFRRTIDAMYPFNQELQRYLITPDTIVCRCEEVSAAKVSDAISEGAVDIYGVKQRVHAGHGRCQGRNCSDTVHQLIARQTGLNPSQVEPYSLRPPAKPVTMQLLAECDSSDL